MAERAEDLDGGSAQTGAPDGPLSMERRSVLDATSVCGPGISAVRWLVVIVPLGVILVAGGFLVRSFLNRPPTISVAWPGWWTPRDRAITPDRPARPALPVPISPTAPRSADRDSTLPRIPWLPDRPSQAPGIPRPAPSPAPQKPVALEPWDFDAADVVSRLASANLRNGSAIFTICAFCHSAEPAGGHRLGPKLWNIMGREKASYADYPYSSALRTQGGRWTYEDLARYLYDTRSAVPGGKMAFAGIRNPDKLADVIAFVRTRADNPQPLPRGP